MGSHLIFSFLYVKFLYFSYEPIKQQLLNFPVFPKFYRNPVSITCYCTFFLPVFSHSCVSKRKSVNSTSSQRQKKTPNFGGGNWLKNG